MQFTLTPTSTELEKAYLYNWKDLETVIAASPDSPNHAVAASPDTLDRVVVASLSSPDHGAVSASPYREIMTAVIASQGTSSYFSMCCFPGPFSCLCYKKI